MAKIFISTDWELSLDKLTIWGEEGEEYSFDISKEVSSSIRMEPSKTLVFLMVEGVLKCMAQTSTGIVWAFRRDTVGRIDVSKDKERKAHVQYELTRFLITKYLAETP